jgi:hypothetical protein
MTPGTKENIKEHNMRESFNNGHSQRLKKLWYVVKCLGLAPSVRRMFVTVREPWVKIAPVLKNKKFSNVGCEKTGANFVNMFIMPFESRSGCIWPSVVLDSRQLHYPREGFFFNRLSLKNV